MGVFRHENQLNEHDEQDERCQLVPDDEKEKRRDYAEGLDQGQERQLRKRTLNRDTTDEFMYWRKIYEILFPDKMFEIPNPG